MEEFVYKSLEDEKNELIVISNEFVAKTRYEFSRAEILALGYILKKIDTKQPDFQEITFSTNDFLHVLGLDGGGRQYREAKKTLMSIRNKGFWLKIEGEEPREVAVSFFDHLEVNPETNLFKVRMNSELMPFFLQLKESIEYPYRYSLEMKNVYCIPLYELILTHKTEKFFSVDIATLRNKLSIGEESYKDYQEFRGKVLKKAIDGINDVTDINVTFKSRSSNGVVTHITFFLEGKQGLNQSPHNK